MGAECWAAADQSQLTCRGWGWPAGGPRACWRGRRSAAGGGRRPPRGPRQRRWRPRPRTWSSGDTSSGTRTLQHVAARHVTRVP